MAGQARTRGFWRGFLTGIVLASLAGSGAGLVLSAGAGDAAGGRRPGA